MNYQMDLFENQYHTLKELKDLITTLHWTGGVNENGTLQYQEYQLDYYKDLAFIVQYQNESDNNEKIIDNCVELILVDNDLYKIIRIDGKTLGEIGIDTKHLLHAQKQIIKWFEKGELFKK